jgi:hypothetical protein
LFNNVKEDSKIQVSTELGKQITMYSLHSEIVVVRIVALMAIISEQRGTINCLTVDMFAIFSLYDFVAQINLFYRSMLQSVSRKELR